MLGKTGDALGTAEERDEQSSIDHLRQVHGAHPYDKRIPYLLIKPPTKCDQKHRLIKPTLLGQGLEFNSVIGYRKRSLQNRKKPVTRTSGKTGPIEDPFKTASDKELGRDRCMARARNKARLEEQTKNIIIFHLIRRELSPMLGKDDPTLQHKPPTPVEIPVKRLGIARV